MQLLHIQIPKIGQWKYQHDRWEHVHDTHLFDIQDLQADGQGYDSAAGFEVCQHDIIDKWQDEGRSEEEQQTDDNLRDCYETDHISSGGSEDCCGEKIHDCFGEQDGMVAGHGGVHGSEDACSAEAEQDDHADDDVHLLLIHINRKFCFQFAESAEQTCLDVAQFSDCSSENHGKDDRREILHLYDQADCDGHGRQTEYIGKGFNQFFGKMLFQKCTKYSTDKDGGAVRDNSIWHIVSSFLVCNCS